MDTIFSNYINSEITEITTNLTNIDSAFYTWLFLWIFIPIYRTINKI